MRRRAGSVYPGGRPHPGREADMITVAFFDMGETLIHDGRPIPGVAAALATVAGFHTADGALLFLGVVSDYFPPAPPPTEAKIAALEQRYRDEILGPSGLAQFFQPFTQRVTLSTRAGVTKPARKVFVTALTRSATGATLAQCLF